MVTAEQLRAARAILQMDQAALAKISGVSVETIKRLERQTGKLQAKDETIVAIRKALESRGIGFTGDSEGWGAGVLLENPDKQQVLRKILIAEWALKLGQSLKAQCATDPKFFEHGANHIIRELTKLTTRIVPAVVHGVLSVPQRGAFVPPNAAESGAVLASWGYMSARNSNTTMPFPSVASRARDDASRLTRQMLGMMEDASDLGSVGNRAFVRAFVDAMPTSDCGALTDAQGALSAEGVIRAKNAILAKAYGDDDILFRITESSDADIKSISDGLILASPQWAKFRADVAARRTHPDFDGTPALMQAVNLITENLSQGRKLGDCLAQQGSFATMPKATTDCIRIFSDADGNRVASAEAIAKKLRTYVEEATKASKRSGLSRK